MARRREAALRLAGGLIGGIASALGVLALVSALEGPPHPMDLWFDIWVHVAFGAVVGGAGGAAWALGALLERPAGVGGTMEGEQPTMRPASHWLLRGLSVLFALGGTFLLGVTLIHYYEPWVALGVALFVVACLIWSKTEVQHASAQLPCLLNSRANPATRCCDMTRRLGRRGPVVPAVSARFQGDT